jgi:hypothetical protein
LAIDSQTNLFVTGSFKSQARFSGLIVTGALNYASMFVVKYDRLGNALWARSAGRGTTTTAILVASASRPMHPERSMSRETLTTTSPSVVLPFTEPAAAVRRTASWRNTQRTESLAWAIKMETSGQASATVVTGLAMDSEANLHVVGFFIGGVGNFGGILLNAGQTGAFSHFHAKLSPSGTGLWVQKVDNIDPTPPDSPQTRLGILTRWDGLVPRPASAASS